MFDLVSYRFKCKKCGEVSESPVRALSARAYFVRSFLPNGILSRSPRTERSSGNLGTPSRKTTGGHLSLVNSRRVIVRGRGSVRKRFLQS